MAVVFRSRIDAKFKVLALGLLGASVMTLWIRPKPTPVALWGVMGLIMFGAAGFALWITFTTYYEIEHDALRVNSGPFSWRIPLAEIRAVRPSDSSASSPAMSMDRLEILYGSGRSILVSPADKAEFLILLQRRIPRLGAEQI